jgi:poly-gamma-glutamate capsule biosynthesis protein CapA/YwtB (metallophosphatase superfamily)
MDRKINIDVQKSPFIPLFQRGSIGGRSLFQRRKLNSPFIKGGKGGFKNATNVYYHALHQRALFLSYILIFSLCLIYPALSDEASVVIVGDIMFGSELAEFMDREGSTAPFAGVSSILKDADVTYGTFEGVISTRGEADKSKKVVFRSKPSSARGLANSGFDVLSLATPHILDYGEEGFLDTLEYLSWYGVKYVGSGINLQEARKPIVLPAKDSKVGFLSYYRGSQFDRLFFASEDKLGPALPIYEELGSDILKAKAESDVVVLSIHWGARVEGPEISDRQKLYAQKAIDSGADIVIGQKINTLQGFEIYKGKPIFYSLGDFIYGTYAKQSAYGYILRLILSEKKLKKVEIIPISISDSKTGSYLPTLIKGQSAQDALKALEELSKEFNTKIDIKDDIGIINID